MGIEQDLEAVSFGLADEHKEALDAFDRVKEELERLQGVERRAAKACEDALARARHIRLDLFHMAGRPDPFSAECAWDCLWHVTMLESALKLLPDNGL